MRKAGRVLLAAVAMWMAGTHLSAHEVTYLGTVIAAQDDTVHVAVIDKETSKTSTMKFSVTPKTKVLRGDVRVGFDEARITKNERIAVTVNHDGDASVALVLRLAARDGH